MHAPFFVHVIELLNSGRVQEVPLDLHPSGLTEKKVLNAPKPRLCVVIKMLPFNI